MHAPLLYALAALPMLTLPAQAMTCIATTQCRGDAVNTCAASTLEIEVVPRGAASAWLWINHQGPYPARAQRDGEQRRWTIDAFGGNHALDLAADGQFVYRGNYRKIYTGRCEGDN